MKIASSKITASSKPQKHLDKKPFFRKDEKTEEDISSQLSIASGLVDHADDFTENNFSNSFDQSNSNKPFFFSNDLIFNGLEEDIPEHSIASGEFETDDTGLGLTDPVERVDLDVPDSMSLLRKPKKRLKTKAEASIENLTNKSPEKTTFTNLKNRVPQEAVQGSPENEARQNDLKNKKQTIDKKDTNLKINPQSGDLHQSPEEKNQSFNDDGTASAKETPNKQKIDQKSSIGKTAVTDKAVQTTKDDQKKEDKDQRDLEEKATKKKDAVIKAIREEIRLKRLSAKDGETDPKAAKEKTDKKQPEEKNKEETKPAATAKLEGEKEKQEEAPTEGLSESQDQETDKQIQHWKKRVGAATGGIKEGDMSSITASPNKMKQKGLAISGGRKNNKQDYKQKAKKNIKPPPKGEKAPPPPPPDPVPEATKMVKTAAEKRLSTQSMPKVTRSPGHPKVNNGQRLFPTLTPSPLKDNSEAPELKKEEKKGSEKKDNPNQKKLDKGLEKKGAENKAGQAPEPVTFEDKGPMPDKPVPGPRKNEVEVVLATILGQRDGLAKRYVDSAVDGAYPKKALREVEPTIVDDMLEQEKAAIEKKILMIGDAAGIARDGLKEKAEVVRKSIEKKQKEVSEQLDGADKEAKEETKKTGESLQKEISAAAETVEDSIIAKQDAAGGAVDTKLIESKRDRQIEKVTANVALGKARFKRASEDRKKRLDTEGRKQSYAYQVTSKSEASKIRAQFEDDTEGRLEAKPTLDWGHQGAKQTKEKIDLLKLEIDQEVKKLTTDLNKAATSAKELIRNWADEKMGRERSWWEKLIDMVRDWVNQSREDNAQWEQAEAKLTKDEILGDFQKLDEIKQAMAEGNQEKVKAITATLSAEEQVIVATYFKTGGNSIAAVSKGTLFRLQNRRIPKLTETAIDRSVALTDYDKLNQLGKSQSQGFDGHKIASQVYDAVAGWGTNENKIFKSLSGLTKVQSKAVSVRYKMQYHESIESALRGDLSGEEKKRALRLLEGDQIGADIAALEYAVDGAGTDEQEIYNVLRNKTPAERAELFRRYKEEHGVDLDKRLKDDMSGLEWERTQALLDGDVSKADAIAIEDARTGFWGPDEEGVDAVYQQVVQEAEAEAKARGMTTAELQAEIRKRNNDIDKKYSTRFADGKEGALKVALETSFTGPEKDLVIGLHEYDPIKIDAARMRMEMDDFFVVDDDKVNSILKNQHERASTNANRDFNVYLREKQREIHERAQKEGWKPERLKEALKTEREKLEKNRDQDIEANSKKNMELFTKQYEGTYDRYLRLDIAFNTSGNSTDMAYDLLAQNGKLSAAQEVFYAVDGAGTDEDALKKAIQGKSKEEIAEIRKEYAALTKKKTGAVRNLDDDIAGDTSGRLEKDMEWALRGKPETPAEMMALIKEKKKWEKEHGSTGIGSWFAGTEERALEQSYSETEAAYLKYQEALSKKKKGEKDSPELIAARGKFYQYAGYVESDIEQFRKGVDRVADTVATVAEITAVVAGAIITGIFTGPQTSVAILALYTGATAAAAGAIGMAARYAIKGDSYGWEDIATDAAITGVDIVASVLTAGMSKALLAGGKLGTMAGGTVTQRMLANFLAEGIEAAAGAFPPALAGAMLSDDTWKADNPFLAILTQAGIGTGAAFLMAGTIGSVLPEIKLPKGARDVLYKFMGDADVKLKGLDEAVPPPKGLDVGPDPKVRGIDGPNAGKNIDDPGMNKIDVDTPGQTSLPDPVPGKKVDVGGNEPKVKDMDELANAKQELVDALPRNLRNEVPIKLDPELKGRDVAVHFDVDDNGLLKNIHVRVGPDATPADIKLHKTVIRHMRLYSGFSGKVLQFIERINIFARKFDPPRDSKAFEAQFELNKLPGVIKSRMKELKKLSKNGGLDVDAKFKLEKDIVEFQRQLEHFKKVLDNFDLDPGRGYVAAKSDVIEALEKTTKNTEDFTKKLKDFEGVKGLLKEEEISKDSIYKLVAGSKDAKRTKDSPFYFRKSNADAEFGDISVREGSFEKVASGELPELSINSKGELDFSHMEYLRQNHTAVLARDATLLPPELLGDNPGDFLMSFYKIVSDGNGGFKMVKRNPSLRKVGDGLELPDLVLVGARGDTIDWSKAAVQIEDPHLRLETALQKQLDGGKVPKDLFDDASWEKLTKAAGLPRDAEGSEELLQDIMKNYKIVRDGNSGKLKVIKADADSPWPHIDIDFDGIGGDIGRLHEAGFKLKDKAKSFEDSLSNFATSKVRETDSPFNRYQTPLEAEPASLSSKLAKLDPESQYWVRWRLGPLMELDDALFVGGLKKQDVLDEILKDLITGPNQRLVGSVDDQIRRRVRESMLELIMAQSTAAKRVEALKNLQGLLDKHLNPSAKGQLFTEFLKSNLVPGAKVKLSGELADVVKGADGKVVAEIMLPDGRRFDLLGAKDGKSFIGVENKAGEGAFKLDQFFKYVDDLVSGGGKIELKTPITLEDGKLVSALDGLMYVFDSPGVVDKAFSQIEDLLKRIYQSQDLTKAQQKITEIDWVKAILDSSDNSQSATRDILQELINRSKKDISFQGLGGEGFTNGKLHQKLKDLRTELD